MEETVLFCVEFFIRSLALILGFSGPYILYELHSGEGSYFILGFGKYTGICWNFLG